MSETEMTEAGQQIAELLGLKPLTEFDPVRYGTTAGTKTALGLYRTLSLFYAYAPN